MLKRHLTCFDAQIELNIIFLGVVSLQGHYPLAEDNNFEKYLTIGPMSRYAEDLPQLLKILAGDNTNKLQLDKEVSIIL